MRTAVATVAALSAALCGAAANAGTMSIAFGSATGLEGLGSFSGSMQWNYAGGSATRGYLTVSLTNTSSIHGYLTAFALNGPKTGFTYSLQAPSTPAENFSMIGGGSNPTSTINAAPWGSYVVGASTSTSWTGGGSPLRGLDVGETGTYTFNVDSTAALLSNLDALSFFTKASGHPEFAVRFRGFDNGGSDKVAAQMIVVPVPMPVALAAAGLLGVGLLRRRATKSAAAR
jgi:hypothetical protein